MVQTERETRCFFCLDLNWAERKGVGVDGRSGVRKPNHSQLNSTVLYESLSVCVCEAENTYVSFVNTESECPVYTSISASLTNLRKELT